MGTQNILYLSCKKINHQKRKLTKQSLLTLTSSNNIAVGPRKRAMVSNRGRIEAWSRPKIIKNYICNMKRAFVTRCRKFLNNEDKQVPAVLRPNNSANVWFSRRLLAPNFHTNTGEIIVMKPAETNLLLIVSGWSLSRLDLQTWIYLSYSEHVIITFLNILHQ